MKTNCIIKTKNVLKIFLPGQDEKEEIWLEEMSAKGWQLETVVPFAYTFSKIEPKHSVIRLDYKSSWDKDYQEYLVTFSDADWTLLTTLGNWHYFNINPKNDVVPEIYNSNRTKAQKYRRVLLGLSPLTLLIVSPLAHAFDFGSYSTLAGLDIALRVFFLLAAFMFIYSFLRVCVKLILLKTSNRE